MIVALLSVLAHAVDVGGTALEHGAIPAEAMAAGLPNRTAPPEVARAQRMPLPDPEVHRLSEAVEVWFVPVDGVRRVEVYVALRRGHNELLGWPTEEAIAVGGLMDVATARYAADTLSELQDVHEIELYSWVGHHSGGASLSVPREALPVGLEMLEEVLERPVFPKDDLTRHLRDRRNYFERTGPASPASVAWAALTYGWFPADHAYGARPDPAAMKKLDRGVVIDLHRRWLASGPVTVVVTGDIGWNALEPQLAALFDGIGADVGPAEPLAVAPPEADRVVAVHMPGQDQAMLRLRLAAPLRDDPDRPAFEVIDYVLGGHFLSRLNANLREDKGFTYGSGSTYSGGETSGHLTIEADVAAENAGAAIGEIEGELRAMVTGGVTPEEIEQAVRAELFEWNETRKTAGTTRSFYSGLLWAEETVAQAAARGDAAAALAPEALQQVAAAWLSEERARLWVVVGDREKLGSQLEALGWEVSWIDPAAAVLGSF